MYIDENIHVHDIDDIFHINVEIIDNNVNNW